jgi:hypothetical protein
MPILPFSLTHPPLCDARYLRVYEPVACSFTGGEACGGRTIRGGMSVGSNGGDSCGWGGFVSGGELVFSDVEGR